MPPTRYATRTDAIDQAIIPALDSLDYDLDAIFDACFTYRDGAFEQTADDAEFWQAVEAADLSHAARIATVARDFATARDTTKTLRDQLRAMVIEATADGMSELEAARRAGVTRMTIRSWLGK
jgi:DNA-directed RNA polymerase specialized sigma24 family protein